MRTMAGAAVDPGHFGESNYVGAPAREFSRAEPVVDFAARNRMHVRGHTLVWHNRNSAWLTGGNFTPAQLSQILEDRIRTVAEAV